MRQRSRQAGRNLGRKSTSVTMTTASRTIQAVLATAPVNSSSLSSTHQTSDSNASSHDEQPAHWAELPRGEQLLNRIVTQWQFGDWTKLAAFDPNDFAHHPHRAKLALFAAAGHQQLGHHDDTRRLVRQAHEWGCDRTLIGRVLISGVYNTLGRANALAGRQSRSRQCIETALAVGAPGQDLALLTPARIQHQFDGTGLPRLDQEVDHASMPALFRCRLELDGQTRWLAFNPASPEHYSVQDGVLSFQLPPGKPGYLVSNETGDFNLPPSVNQLPLAPDTIYRFNVRLAAEQGEKVVIWLFDYTKSGKVQKQSFVLKSGEVEVTLRTSVDHDKAALGIRLGGEGRLPIRQIAFAFISGLHAEAAYYKDIAYKQQEAVCIGSLVHLPKHAEFDKKKTRIKVFGTFRSGTNYLRALLEWNTCSEVIFSSIGGWKHGLINDANKMEMDEHGLYCVCIVKDPLASLVSWFDYYQKVGLNMDCSKSWEDFLRERFVIFDSGKQSGRNQYRFSNPVDYWNSMNWNLLNFCQENPEKSILIRYEDLLRSPSSLVMKISDKFDVPIFYSENELVLTEKKLTRMGDGQRDAYEDYLDKEDFDRANYIEKKYLSKFSGEQLAFVSSLLDKDLMIEFNYGI